MPFTRTYCTVIPIEPDADVAVLRWLARESFERKAVSDGLRVVDYSEGTVEPDDLPPNAAKQLQRPLTDFQWFRFTASATNDPTVIGAALDA